VWAGGSEVDVSDGGAVTAGPTFCSRKELSQKIELTKFSIMA
jgi:hypothetical protein